MKAIHTAQTNQPKLNPVKKENASVSFGPVPVVSSARSHPSFALRCANKLKEFFGLFSIILPQTQRGGTSKYISRLRKLRIVGSFASIMLVFISTGIIIPYYIKTNNSEATAGQAIGSTLTFSAESLTASVSLSNLDKDGTFATSGSDEQAEFSIATDNFTGYTLTMRTSDGNALKSADPTTNTDTFTSIQSNISASTFSNSANTTYNNQWGIISNYYYSNNATIANTDTYLKVPAANESITLDVTSAKNTEAKNYTIGIGARADYTNKIDTYSNTFILEYIANPVTYSITYNANAGSDTVANMPTTNPQTGSTSGGTVNSVNLTSNIPTRIGYTFKGWCSVSTSDDTCSGTIYNDQTVEAANRIMNYGIDQTIDNTLINLYAMWTRNNATYSLTLDANGGTNAPTVNNIINNTGSATFTLPTTIPTYEGYNFLGWCSAATSDNTCSGTTYSYDESTTSFNPSTITLTQTNLATSTISSSLYAIWELAAKTNISQLETMQDFASLSGQEYMAVLGSMTLNEGYELSDIRDSTKYHIGKLADGRVWMLDNLALGSADKSYTLTSTDSNVTTDFTLPKSANTGFTSYNNAMINADSKDTVPNKVYGTEGSGKIGVYYNYAAASAGKIKGSSNSSNGDANQDICPKNWRLPTGGSSGEFQALYTAYSSNVTNFRNALSLPLSGRFYDSSAGNQGSGGYGRWWSSTRYNNTSMYRLYVDESSVDPQNSSGRNDGFSVRCVLKDPRTIDDIEYMQDMNLAIADKMTNGDSATLTDKRDGKQYTVKKMDGYLIMTENLAYIGGNNGTASAGNAVSANGTTFSMTSSTSSSFTSPYYYNSNNDSYGVYYNYCAASGKQQCIESSAAGSAATDSICPAGWMLPTSPSESSWGGISTTTIKNSGDFNVYAGYYSNGSPYGVGSYGRWWSATPRPSYAYHRYYLDFNGSNINAQNDITRNVLFSVRCVLSR